MRLLVVVLALAAAVTACRRVTSPRTAEERAVLEAAARPFAARLQSGAAFLSSEVDCRPAGCSPTIRWDSSTITALRSAVGAKLVDPPEQVSRSSPSKLRLGRPVRADSSVYAVPISVVGCASTYVMTDSIARAPDGKWALVTSILTAMPQSKCVPPEEGR